MVLVVVPLDEIKIDKAFVLGLGADADPADVAIVQAVIAMARPLPSEALEQWVRTASWGGCADKMWWQPHWHWRSFAVLRMTGESAA